MMKIFDNSKIYLGISGVKISFDELILLQGVTARRVYAHFMSPHMVALESPTHEKLAPSPWKTVRGSSDKIVHWELEVDLTQKPEEVEAYDYVKTMVSLLRLGLSPQLHCFLISSVSFESKAEFNDSDPEVSLWETNRVLVFKGANDELSQSTFGWISENLERCMALIYKHYELKLAVSSLDEVNFQQSLPMSLVLLWGALEAIFTKDKAELRFRVSVMVASYLEPDDGDKAYLLYKKVAKLYNERSKAAHGDNSVKQETLLQTYEILYRSVEKMFEQNSVPTKESLERSLLG